MASNMDGSGRGIRYLVVLRRPIYLITINFFLVNTLFSLLPVRIGNIAYNAGRISIILYAGWLMIRRGAGGIGHAALAGVIIYFFDHVLLKGSVFLLNHIWKPQGLGFAAFAGTLISFVLFAPLALLFGALGGVAARSLAEQSSSDPD